MISNGLPLTKIHHAAFDAHLIGVDPDCRIHVSDRLLEIHDGPFLELGLKGIAGTLIDRPNRSRTGLNATGWRFGSSKRPHSFDRTKRHVEEADRCDKHGAQAWSIAPRRSTASTTIGAARVEQPQSPQVTA